MSEPLQSVVRRLAGCASADRRRLTQRLRAVLRDLRSGRARPPDLAGVERRIEESCRRVEARRARVPAISYPEDLPVSQRRHDLREALEDHQVIIVCGETGSGKTTQLPKLCLEMGRGVAGMIGHTQPRRIAARSVAARIAEELGAPRGIVGYKVRFGDATSPDTLIKIMTDGILLAETQGDPDLEQYDTIIIDEAHERSLNIDFLLGYLRRLLPRRPDLKVIVTSATIDPERFSEHFGGAPIVMVSGRTYPVEVLYRSPTEVGSDERDEGMQRHIVDAVDECAARGEGDILIFLSGEREIRETAESLSRHHVPGAPGTRVLPLYAKLSAGEQMEVFRPHTHRRIVLATNVAETSLTVPGIRFVIDTGVARVARYSARTKIQRLEVEAVSRASADQRAGRCGRVGPGVCIRLYDEQDYLARSPFTDPEIVRSNLAAVILRMIALRLGRVEEFPFLEPPDSRLVQDGYDTLRELGAISASGDLTPVGRGMARLPIDPRIARMLLAAKDEPGCCLADVLVIASALSVQDPRDRPLEKQGEADAAHRAFRDPRSDFLTLLRLWDWYQDRKRHLSGSKLRRACRDAFLSFVRMREWEDIHRQLAELLGSLSGDDHPRGRPRPASAPHGLTRRPALDPLPDPEAPPQPENMGEKLRIEALHRALLTGLLSNVGVKGEQGEYDGARAVKFRIFPGSTLYRAGPKWIFAAELVRTSALYGRTLAPADPAWIEAAATHLLKRSHFDPHWDARSGRVMAFERVTLFGLELAARRRVHFGPIDPVRSREILIEHGLVRGAMLLEAPFLAHNQGVVESLQLLEVRSRHPGALVSPERLAALYAARLPPDVTTAAALDRWYEAAPAGAKAKLLFSTQDLVDPETPVPTREDFPDALESGPLRLPLEYRCEPGHEADGVTVRIPTEALSQFPDARGAWLIPGLLAERVECMLQALPKEVRRLLPGIPASARTIAGSIPFGEESLAGRVADAVRTLTGVEVSRHLLEEAPLPPHLRFRYEVLDEQGNPLAAGRDLPAIRAHLAARARGAAGGMVLAGAERYTKDGLASWDFGELPERVEIARFGTRFVTTPALVDQGRAVGLRLYEDPLAAAAATRAGLRRLFMLDAADEIRRATHRHPEIERLAVAGAALGTREWREGLVTAAVDRALRAAQPPPRTAEQFRARSRAAIDGLSAAVREVCALAEPIVGAFQRISVRLDQRHPEAWAPALADIRDQLRHLLPPDFLIRTPPPQLPHFPRYLGAIERRLDRLAGAGVARDAERLAELNPIWQGYHELVRRQKELGLSPAAIQEYRWMVEELRVSMFAQELRTAFPVSPKRLHEKWEEIVRG